MNNTMKCEIDISSGSLISTVVYSCTLAIGLPLNVIAICGLYQLRLQTGLLLTYVLNLLIADLLYLMTLPLWIIYNAKGRRWLYGEATCKLTGFVSYVDMYTGIYFLTWAAIDRYLAIVHPLRSRGLRTKKFAFKISVCGWIVCALASLGFVLPFRFTENEWCLEMYPLLRTYAILKMISICIAFIIPCFILCFTYGNTMRAIQRSTSLEPDEKKRIQYLLFTVGFIFFILFGPFHIVYIYRIIVSLSAVDVCDHESSVPFYFNVTLALMTLNNIFDPLLYIFVCEDIRRKLYNCCAQIMLSVAGLYSTSCFNKHILNRLRAFVRSRGNTSSSVLELHQNPAS